MPTGPTAHLSRRGGSKSLCRAWEPRCQDAASPPASYGDRLGNHCATSAASASGALAPFTIEPVLLDCGACIDDASLHRNRPVEELCKHRVLVFRGQGRIGGARHLEISHLLEEVERICYDHPRSLHPDTLSASNDERDGCTGVGRAGWYLDGRCQPCYQTTHLYSMCEGGETWFVPLKEFVEMPGEGTRSRCSRLCMLTGRRQNAHPTVYEHPVPPSNTTLLCHCGPLFRNGWAKDDNTVDPFRSITGGIHPGRIQDELPWRMDEAVDFVGVKISRRNPGDSAATEDLRNCHYALPRTKHQSEGRGLHIPRCITTAGEAMPRKVDLS